MGDRVVVTWSHFCLTSTEYRNVEPVLRHAIDQIPVGDWLYQARSSLYRNEDASKKIFVATGILVFDFELFIGVRVNCHEYESVFLETCIGNATVL